MNNEPTTIPDPAADLAERRRKAILAAEMGEDTDE